MSGYVLIHRKLLANKAFRNKTEAWAFADLVLQAAWQQTLVHYKRSNVTLERGQVCISVRDFAAQWGWSKSATQRFFDRLIEAKMLGQSRDSGGTVAGTAPNVLTICNYDKYQASNGAAGTVAGTGTGTLTGTQNKEVMKERKDSPAKAGVSPKAAPKMPLQEAVDNWNSMAGAHGWKQILSLNDKRAEHLRCRLREHGLGGWIDALKKAGNSVYLGGSSPPTWFTFDWLVKSPTNFLKLMEGNYDRSRETAADEPSSIRLAVEQLIGSGGR